MATFTVKLGPTTANYRGTIKIESIDEATHTATLARERDRQARPGRRDGDDRQHARGHRLGRDAGRRRVTDFSITGRLASFGRGGMIKDISNRLLRDFASCLQARLEAAPAAAAPAAEGGGAMTAEEAAASAGAAEQVDPASPPAPAPSQPPPPAAAPPVKGFSLLVGVLWDRIKGLFRRGS